MELYHENISAACKQSIMHFFASQLSQPAQGIEEEDVNEASSLVDLDFDDKSILASVIDRERGKEGL